jgi:hypothetical protein
MLAGKKFSTNEEVIAETEAYFEAKEKSYCKNGIEKLYNRNIIVVSPSKVSKMCFTMLAYELFSPTYKLFSNKNYCLVTWFPILYFFYNTKQNKE